MHPDTEAKPDVTFEQFLALDWRVGLVESAPLAEGTRAPSRVLTIDLGPLGTVRSVAQLAMVDEEELVGRKVVVCRNLGRRQIGKYMSEALTLGTLAGDSPEGQAQALPLWAHEDASPGDPIF